MLQHSWNNSCTYFLRELCFGLMLTCTDCRHDWQAFWQDKSGECGGEPAGVQADAVQGWHGDGEAHQWRDHVSRDVLPEGRRRHTTAESPAKSGCNSWNQGGHGYSELGWDKRRVYNSRFVNWLYWTVFILSCQFFNWWPSLCLHSFVCCVTYRYTLMPETDLLWQYSVFCLVQWNNSLSCIYRQIYQSGLRNLEMSVSTLTAVTSILIVSPLVNDHSGVIKHGIE